MTDSADSHGMTCVYCHKQVSGDAASCPECGKTFPWSKKLDEMRDLMKEREPNRVKATWVVVEEVFGYLNTGKPLSQSAVKGLISAWLFPRTLIVLGSVITGIVLVAQTLILKRQTELLDVQTKAAQIDQESGLRKRLAEVTPYRDAWARMVGQLERPLDVKDCKKCSREEEFSDELGWLFQRQAGLLQNEMMAAIYTLGQLTELEREERPWGAAIDAFAIASAKICFMAPADTTSLRTHMRRYVGGLAWMAKELESDSAPGSIGKMAAYAADIPLEHRDYRGSPSSAVTNGAVIEAMERRRRNAAAVASNAMKDCRDLLIADQDRLKLMLPAAPQASLREVVDDEGVPPAQAASWPRSGASGGGGS